MESEYLKFLLIIYDTITHYNLLLILSSQHFWQSVLFEHYKKVALLQ